jgi:hypothetical protein
LRNLKRNTLGYATSNAALEGKSLVLYGFSKSAFSFLGRFLTALSK